MTIYTQWLLVIPVAVPLLGAVIGLLLLLIDSRSSRAASLAAISGLAGGCVGAMALLTIMLITGLPIVAAEPGTWLVTAGVRPQQINWGWQVDKYAVIWLTVMTTLAWLTATYCGDKSPSAAAVRVKIATAIIVASASGLVMAATLVHMFAYWLMLSVGTLLLTGRSSSASASQGMHRALVVGLMSDLLLFWAVVLIGVEGSSSFTSVVSNDGLRRLAVDNPAIIGLIGSLIVISSLCRCGLFPWFGWHFQSSTWGCPSCILIYAVGYVPSGIWVLLKCQPLLAASETSLTLLGGFGTLGAVLGAFVAGGQVEQHRRLAYLVTSQMGVVLVALGSGRPHAVALCICHLCIISIAAFLLFGSPRLDQEANRTSSMAAWCGSLAIAGLLPFGWTQHSLLELNTRPMQVRSLEPASTDNAADATNPSITTAEHWEWMYGLWIAQGLSAFAIAGGLARSRPLEETGSSRVPMVPSLPGPALGFVSILLLTAGIGIWLRQIIATPVSSSEWMRWGIGQVVVLIGFVSGWRTGRAALPTSAGGVWESLARLRRERMYVDPLFQSVFRVPWHSISRFFVRSVDATAIDRAWRRLLVQGTAWIGFRIEALQVSRIDFCVATMLLGTATLLLTLILVA
ncbi:MAG TPA: proton-conducting transporter membrane subunit [Schlesneria sp.]|jgi:NADH:ubiquinone oxidoreductase subunit 5 (subunit L)/multisubunit Na+/H+ antiporter MnhA subunit